MQNKNLNKLAVDLSKVQMPTTLDKETWEIKNEIYSEIIEAIYKYKEITNPIITLEEYIAEHLARSGVMPKTKIKDLTLENAKLTNCVQDLFKDQDVLENSLKKSKQEKAKIFEEIEESMRCFEDDDDGYLLKKCEFEFFMRELKKKHIGKDTNVPTNTGE